MDTPKTPPPIPFPTNNDGLSTHFAYMRRDLDEIKSVLRDALKEMKDGFIARTEFNEHEKRDQDHEDRIRVLEKKAEIIDPNKYITEDAFTPVKRVVYGLVTAIGLAVIGAILNMILK